MLKPASEATRLFLTVFGSDGLPSAGMAVALRMAIERSCPLFKGLPISVHVLRNDYFMAGSREPEVVVRIETIHFHRFGDLHQQMIAQAIGECLQTILPGRTVSVLFSANDQKASVAWSANSLEVRKQKTRKRRGPGSKRVAG